MKRSICCQSSQRIMLFPRILMRWIVCIGLALVASGPWMRVADAACSGTSTNATCTAAGFTITDTNPPTVATSTNAVSGFSGGTTTVSITLTFGPAPRLDDLDMLLVHHNGANNLEFMSDAGATASFSGTISLADSGASCIPNSSTPVSGTTYRPADYSTSENAANWGLSLTVSHAGLGCSGANGTVTFAQAFNGLSPNGTWTLYARDDAIGGTGGTTVSSWSLSITTNGTAARVESLAATPLADAGVQLIWRTGFEVDNLGFNVYREEAGRQIKLNPSVIAGSALLAAPGTVLSAGRSYTWWDRSTSASEGARYWLEEIDLNGQRTWHGPASWERPSPPDHLLPSSHTPAPYLSGLGRVAPHRPPSAPFARHAMLASPAAPASARQALLAAQPAIKLGVRQEGWYRVTQPELLAAGLPPDADPRFLGLFVDGHEVPMAVSGQDDGRFDPTDVIEFYGLGLDESWTDMRVYWLVAGARPGRRIAAVSGSGDQPSDSGFPFSVERKERTVYFSALRNGEQENFFGAVVSPEPVQQSLFLQHLDPSPAGATVLEVGLQGVTSGAHLVQVSLNGIGVGDLSFQDQELGSNSFPIAASSLHEAENLVELSAQGGDQDISLVDRIRLTYWHTYTADANALQFTALGRQRVTVGGFSSAAVRVLDVTDADAAREVTAIVQPREPGFAVTLVVPGDGPRTLLAFTPERAQAVASITTNQPSHWRRPAHGADLVIISHGEFMPHVGSLRAQRQSQGLRVAVVDVEDIYDELSAGHKTPYAVRDFLSYVAKQWSPVPRFVLLVGDASLDPKNYLDYGSHDFVPTKLIDTAFMETASDDWLADFDEDGLPEMAVGRLPVRTSEDAERVLTKIVGYNQAGADSGVLLVTDLNDDFDFAAMDEALEELIPPTIPVENIDRGQTESAAARSQLLASLNRGPWVVNYTGHGSVDLWRGNLLTADDAVELKNAQRLSVFVTMTCLNGYFHDAALESLAEALLHAPGGGAVAVWAPSGITGPSSQALMNQELFRWLFTAGSPAREPLTLGEAIGRAKAAAPDDDVRRTWILLGDPAMPLRF